MILKFDECEKCEKRTRDIYNCIHICDKPLEALKEFNKYKDLEEQGKLLKLPCKLGDKSFWISDEDENGNKVLNVREGNPIVGISVMEDGIYIMTDGDMDYQKVGTRWAYLTREEAEAALSKLQR